MPEDAKDAAASIGHLEPGLFPPIVDIDELRAALTKVLKAVETQYGSRVQIEQDFYRIAPVDQAFDVVGPDPEWTMGSLVDDVESVRSFCGADDDEFVSIWHELAHLAGVLRALEFVDRC